MPGSHGGRACAPAASMCWDVTDTDTITGQHMVHKPQPHRLSYPHGPCNSAWTAHTGQLESKGTSEAHCGHGSISRDLGHSLCHGRRGSQHDRQTKGFMECKDQHTGVGCSGTTCLGCTEGAVELK